MKMSHRFKFIHQQLDRTHLVIWSSTAGFLLLVVARAIAMFMAWLMPELAMYIKTSVLPMEYLGTGLLAFVLGPLSALWLNFFDDKEAVSASAIKNHGNELEKLLLDADGKELMFTLTSGKVYIGYFVHDPADLDRPDAWLRILPILSGYRVADSKEVKLTTNYLAKFIPEDTNNAATNSSESGSQSSQLQDMKKFIGAEAFHKLVRLSDIESCSLFDPAVWDGFHNEDQEDYRQ